MKPTFTLMSAPRQADSGSKPRRSKRRRSRPAFRISGGQEFLAVKDAVRAGEETEGLQSIVHVLASSGKPHHRARHQDAGDGDGAHELDGIEGRCIGERGSRHFDQQVDRHALRMLGEIGELHQQTRAVGSRLSHADDAATADLDPCRAHVGERFEPVLVAAGGDDLERSARGWCRGCGCSSRAPPP